MLNAIVAYDINRTIGSDQQIPWRLPADLKHFKKVTMSHPIIMGRKTHESIGRPLPGRRNIVLSRDKDYFVPGCEIVHSIDQALAAVNDEDAFVIGGGQIYRSFLPKVDKIYVTEVEADLDGDTTFPELKSSDWKKIKLEEFDKDNDNEYSYTFNILERM